MIHDIYTGSFGKISICQSDLKNVQKEKRSIELFIRYAVCCNTSVSIEKLLYNIYLLRICLICSSLSINWNATAVKMGTISDLFQKANSCSVRINLHTLSQDS